MAAEHSIESIPPVGEKMPTPVVTNLDTDHDCLQAVMDVRERNQQYYNHKLVLPFQGTDGPLYSLALRVRGSDEPDRSAFGVSTLQIPDWYDDRAERIEILSGHSDGWKGPDSYAPKIEAKRCALEMLRKLAQARIPRRPLIGLDFEGTFSFSWLDQDVSVDLTVYGDGTYSFFASSAERSASADDEPITKPLHSKLLSTLRS